MHSSGKNGLRFGGGNRISQFILNTFVSEAPLLRQALNSHLNDPECLYCRYHYISSKPDWQESLLQHLGNVQDSKLPGAARLPKSSQPPQESSVTPISPYQQQ